ncbi:MAG: EAL domain-containing protein, partial [Acidimicrobiales bacterium]
VRELVSSPHDLAISRAIIAMAHSLRLCVIAEGVETEGQLALLSANGCDEMQGYLFSRPLTPEHFEQLLMLEAVSQGPGRLLPPLLGVPRLLGAAS